VKLREQGADARRSAMTPVIKTRGLCRNYVVGTETVHALRDVSVVIERNEYSADRRIVLRDGVISSDAPTKHEVVA